MAFHPAHVRVHHDSTHRKDPPHNPLQIKTPTRNKRPAFLNRVDVSGARELLFKPSKKDLQFLFSLSILLLDVACDVHEEGDWQQQGLHNVGNVEVSTSVNLGPLGVIVVEPEIQFDNATLE